MWPSEANPDLGSFLVPLTLELEHLGHEVEVVSISRRAGRRPSTPGSPPRPGRPPGEADPDVVFAHFLFPAGAAGAVAARAAGAPLVVMAHGQDVANLGRIPGVTRRHPLGAGACRRRDRQLALARGSAHREDPGGGGEDRGRRLRGRPRGVFAPSPPSPPAAQLDWDGDGPRLLCVGSLIERKNVVRLAAAFERLGRGRLAFVGDGPLRGALEGRAGVRIIGRIPQAEVPRWIAACDVLCQPSLVEPFGQAALEGMAMERSVLATTVGGPPEFVPPEAGVLVDPNDTGGIAAALELATTLPSPNPAARAAAAEHEVGRQAARMAAVLERAVTEQS